MMRTAATKPLAAMTYGALALAAGVSFLMPKELSVPTSHGSGDVAAGIELEGVLRDFRRDHPDFDLSASAMHVAEMVKPALVGGRPMFNPSETTGGVDRFVINEGEVIPLVNYAAQVDVLGAAISYGGYYDEPVTVKVHVGPTTFTPFGSFDDPLGGSVNDDNNPRTYVFPEAYDAATGISVTASKWLKHNRHSSGNSLSHWYRGGTRNSENDRPFVIILRDGDDVPDRTPFMNQNSIEHFIAPFIDVTAQTVTLSANQAIFLFELGASNPNDVDADFQDLVVLVTLSQDLSDLPVDVYSEVVEETANTDGGGFEVAAQWTNSGGENIPPHLAQTGGGGVAVEGSAFFVNGEVLIAQGSIGGVGGGAMLVTNTTEEDGVTFASNADFDGDVFIGPGGDPDTVVSGRGAISGDVLVLGESFDMPEVAEPSGMPGSSGNVTYYGGTISGDKQFGRFSVRKNKTVTVIGDVRILCDDFEMQNNSALELAAGATLELYVRGDVTLRNNTELNAVSADPSRVTMYHLGTGTVSISNSHDMYGTVIAPEAHLHIRNNSSLTGAFIVDSLTLETGGTEMHMMAGATVSTGNTGACGVAYDDTAGSSGGKDDGAVTSSESFNQWFRDDMDANLSWKHSITLAPQGDGSYRFRDATFYPLDNLGVGNEDESHNNNFTYAVQATFEYDACAGQFVEMEGGDGAWLFIDAKLAIDLGGVQTGASQYLDLDRLDLTDGETYTFKLYWANRGRAGSMLDLHTNLFLGQGSQVATATLPFD